MHYDPRNNGHKAHGLPHDPFKALVAPRPIGWISSLDREGRANLAPYSFFNAVCEHPHLVMFSSFDRKDSQANVEETGEFVCNLATWSLREAMNVTSAPAEHGVDEFELAGLERAPSVSVKPPRVAASPIAMECIYTMTVPLKGADGTVGRYAAVFGEVVHIHIDDSVMREGKVDLSIAEPIARCGYRDYAHVASLFQMTRPTV